MKMVWSALHAPIIIEDLQLSQQLVKKYTFLETKMQGMFIWCKSGLWHIENMKFTGYLDPGGFARCENHCKYILLSRIHI